jgi:predicted lipid-binding transport protein (Tim44 family)
MFKHLIYVVSQMRHDLLFAKREDNMDATSDWVEIAVLAALAGFVAWRLISVLGSRTGHEPPPVDRRSMPENSSENVKDIFSRRPRTDGVATAAPPSANLPAALSETLRTRINEVHAADSSFDYARFTDGARAAYPLILDAFWKNETETLRPLLSDEVFAGFQAAIAARDGGIESAPRLQRLHDAEITDALVVAGTVQITVRFTATITSNDGPITSEDIWTFSRHTRSDDPNWLLTATDDSIGS